MLQPPIRELLNRLTHPEPQVRWSVGLVLDKLAGTLDETTLHEMTTEIAAKLAHPDPGVRSNAAAVLPHAGRAMPPRTLDLAIASLLNSLKDPASEVRAETVRALGELGARHPASSLQIFKALMKLLKDSDPPVGAAVLISMGTMGMELDDDRFREAVSALVSALGNTRPELRMNAAWGLGKLAPRLTGAPAMAAMNALKSAETSERNPDVLYHLQDARRALQHSAPNEP